MSESDNDGHSRLTASLLVYMTVCDETADRTNRRQQYGDQNREHSDADHQLKNCKSTPSMSLHLTTSCGESLSRICDPPHSIPLYVSDAFSDVRVNALVAVTNASRTEHLCANRFDVIRTYCIRKDWMQILNSSRGQQHSSGIVK